MFRAEPQINWKSNDVMKSISIFGAKSITSREWNTSNALPEKSRLITERKRKKMIVRSALHASSQIAQFLHRTYANGNRKIPDLCHIFCEYELHSFRSAICDFLRGLVTRRSALIPILSWLPPTITTTMRRWCKLLSNKKNARHQTRLIMKSYGTNRATTMSRDWYIFNFQCSRSMLSIFRGSICLLCVCARCSVISILSAFYSLQNGLLN